VVVRCNNHSLRRINQLKKLFSVLALAFLAGCATQPAVTADEIAEANVPLTCDSDAQCTLYWRRAQAWVAINSRMKIQLATDTVIETYNPVNHDPVYAFRFVRTPQSAGPERIMVYVACGNMIGCPEPKERVVIRLKRYVRTGA
jgi:hypothetical protein